MSYVERLRNELMGSLGFAVDRTGETPSPAARRCRGDRGAKTQVWGRKGRRRLSDATAAVQKGVPYSKALHLQDKPQGMRDTRPQSAILRRRASRTAGRSASASSTRCSSSRHTNGGGGANKEMDVLMEICRDQGRTSSVNPADFDSSISAIVNIPVKQFMGAAKQGWGPYFRKLHDKMRKEETTDNPATRMNRPPPDRRQRQAQSLPWGAPASHRQHTKAVYDSRQTAHYTGDNNRRKFSSVGSLKRRQQNQTGDDNNFDGSAALRAKATKREAEQKVIRKLAIRLQMLWHELKIPSPDRAYIEATYLEAGGGGSRGGGSGRGGPGAVDDGGDGTGTPTNGEVYRELARQIRLLLEHRAATIQVLRSVNLRESRLNEVEQALRAFQWHRGLDTDAEGVISALVELRDASVDVVRAVMNWRRNLWQPCAFCWRGFNYLEKMSHDADFLRSPVGTSFLASVGLRTEDMTLVLFPAAGDDGASASPSPPAPQAATDDDVRCQHVGKKEKTNIVRPPPAIVRLTPKAELVSQYRARFFERSSAACVVNGGDQGGAGARAGTGGENDEGRRLGKTAGDDLVAAAAEAELELIVLEEAALQRKVEAERDRLAAKGCFVPLLRWLPGDNNNATGNGKRRQPTSSSPPVPPPASAHESATPTPAAQMDGTTDDPAIFNDKHGQTFRVELAEEGPDVAAPPPRTSFSAGGAFAPSRKQQHYQPQQGRQEEDRGYVEMQRRDGRGEKEVYINEYEGEGREETEEREERERGEAVVVGGGGRKCGEEGEGGEEAEQDEQDEQEDQEDQAEQEQGEREEERSKHQQQQQQRASLESDTHRTEHMRSAAPAQVGRQRAAEGLENRHDEEAEEWEDEDTSHQGVETPSQVHGPDLPTGEHSHTSNRAEENPGDDDGHGNQNRGRDTLPRQGSSLFIGDGEEQLQPPEMGMEAAGEAEVAEERADIVGADDERRHSELRTTNAFSGDTTGIAGSVNDDNPCGLGGLISRKSERPEGNSCDDREERSVAPSVCYDEDFEDDARSCSSGDFSEGNNVRHSSDERGGSWGLPENDDAGHQDQHRSALEAICVTRDVVKTVEETAAAFHLAENCETVTHEITKGKDERERQQQLSDERESAVTTAARRIQRSVRAWLHHRRRLSESRICVTMGEEYFKKPGKHEEEEDSAKNKQGDQLEAHRAGGHPKETQQHLTDTVEYDLNAAASRIQAAVRGMIALDKDKRELRRRSEPKRQAAVIRIQAFERRRQRNPATAIRGQLVSAETSDQQKSAEPKRTSTAEQSDCSLGQEGVKASSTVPAEPGSRDKAERETQSAIAIQRAVRRAGTRRRLPYTPENTTDGADEMSPTDISREEATFHHGAQGSNGQEAVLNPRDSGSADLDPPLQERPEGASSSISPFLSASDGLHSSSPSVLDGPPMSSSSSGGGSFGVSLSNDDLDDPENATMGPRGAAGGGGGGMGGMEGDDGADDGGQEHQNLFDPVVPADAEQPTTSLPPPEGSEDCITADAAEDEQPQQLNPEGRESWGEVTNPRLSSPTHPTAGKGNRSAKETTDEKRQAQEGKADNSSLDDPVASSPHCPSLDGDALADVLGTTGIPDTVMGAINTIDIGAVSLGPSAVALASVPERQALVSAAASASEYGSDDLDFDALSSSGDGDADDAATAAESAEEPARAKTSAAGEASRLDPAQGSQGKDSVATGAASQANAGLDEHRFV